MYYVLYNPLSSNGKSTKYVLKIGKKLQKQNIEYKVGNLIDISQDIDGFAEIVSKEDKLILVGGDGTLHRFVNGIKHLNNPCEVYLYCGGTGNDFGREFKKKNSLINITEHIKNLPSVKLDSDEELFLNGCGLGVDGEVCLMVNDKENKKKGFNYIKSAIRLLRKFKCYDLDLEVDGVRHSYKNVWFLSINNGKYFGGGMKISPKSNRNDNILEATVVHSVKFWKILLIFPLIFIGKHLWFRQVGISEIKGQNFKVSASRELTFQTDGEVKTGVSKFEINIK